MTLRQSTNWLAERRDAAEWLRLADKYIGMYETDKKRFNLPDDHRQLESIVKKFAGDVAGFAEYILEIRNGFERGTPQYDNLNKLYRGVFTRGVQRERRARADMAVHKAIDQHGPPPSFSERLSWIARREADWADRRLAFLEKVRHSSGYERLSREETNVLLRQFWASIDDEISAKGVPRWDR